MLFKDRVAEAIEQSGKTRADIARACKVTSAAVTFWLNGDTTNLKADTALALEEATGYRAQWILSGSGTKKPMPEHTPLQLRLMRIRDERCGGNASELARRIQKDPTYINRLFYPADKAGAKGIGLEIMDACKEAFGLPAGYWDGVEADGAAEPRYMLTGVELGTAIRAAAKKKGVKFVEVARHFRVSSPSVQSWLTRGTIDKAKLPKLWAYFSDVVGPEHWGLAAYPTTTGDLFGALTENERTLIDDYRLLTDDDQQELASEIAQRAAKLRAYLRRMNKAA